DSSIDLEPASNPDVVRWALPDKLREISGLALTRDQRLLAITDEEAIVYEYDYQHGRLVKAFALGEPTLRDDFEGIAVLNDTVWLMNSKGDLYSAIEGEDGERLLYQKHKFIFKDDCELEGLAADEAKNALILICKDAKRKKDRLFFEWSFASEPAKTRLPEADITASLGEKRFHPSGVEINPANGNLWIVAAREHAVIEVARDGTFIGVIMRLDSARHRQVEGITMTDDGRLLIADEADSGPATLAIYRMQ
ncbi:MAG: hypothetical protein HOI35_13210, partial [Woeseia sp.]|nr:hypothetical protein [Woeseia sp.]